MSLSMRLLGYIGLVVFVVPRAESQDTTLPRPTTVQCYRLTLGNWSRSRGVNARYHELPAVIRLDSVAAARGGWRVTPDIAFPTGGDYPGMPRWTHHADSIEIAWSNGFQATTIRLRATQEDELHGTASVFSDANEFGSDPPHASVAASRVSCAAVPSRTMSAPPHAVVKILDSAQAPYVWNELKDRVTLGRVAVTVAERTDTLVDVIDPDLMVVTGDTVAGLRVRPRDRHSGERQLFILLPAFDFRAVPLTTDIPFYYRDVAISPTARYVAYVGSADEGDYPAVRDLSSGRIVVRGDGGGGCNCEVDLNHARWIDADSVEIATAYTSSRKGWLIFSARLSTRATHSSWVSKEPRWP